jgi:hypothetical protein
VGIKRQLGGECETAVEVYINKRIQIKEYQIYITFLTATNTKFSLKKLKILQ